MNLNHLKLAFAVVFAGALLRGEGAVTAESPVTGDEIVDSVKAELLTHFNLIGNLQLEIVGPWKAPEQLASTWTVQVAEFPSIAASSMAVRCRFMADGKTVGDSMIVFHAALWRDAWFARQPLASGTTFDASSLEAHRVDAFKDRDALPTTVGDDAFVIAVTIPAGRGLTWHDVARRPLVRKGEMVEVTASEGALVVNMKAVALENGARGDVVNVRNTESSKTIPAVVVADNRVEVRF